MVDSIPAVQRVILQAGHGMGNTIPKRRDPGASSQYGEEAGIVDSIVEAVEAEYWQKHTDTCTSPYSISVIRTPRCKEACADTHPTYSHLAFTIEWINEVAMKVKGGYVDVILSIHMDSLDAKYSGPLVVIDDRAGVGRYHEAQEIARILSQVLGLPNRGVITDKQTPRKSISIVEKTRPPAFLLELGNIQNERDVMTVKECGAQAIIAVIEAMARSSFGDRSRAANRAKK